MEPRNHSKNGAKPKSHTSRKIKNQINMKNFTKIMTVVGVIAIASLLLAFVPTSSADEGNEKFLTVRVIEAQSGLIGSFIIIVDENGKQETIELEKIGTKTASYVKNATQINNTLNSIGEKGYKLVGQSGGFDQFMLTTTYTFAKK